MTLAFSWIKTDETAKDALIRILTERPLVVLPAPLHRLSLRAGNVVEIVGPSPSAKTLVLIQAAINCILPKEWKGVQYGGLERAVFFIDLDCRFDVLSLSRALERRIVEANGLRSSTKGNEREYDKELFGSCMRRFLYTRCYNSFEFLSTLKTLHFRLQKEKEKQASAVYMLMIDSIGAFYWMDRALPSSSLGSNNRTWSSMHPFANLLFCRHLNGCTLSASVTSSQCPFLHQLDICTILFWKSLSLQTVAETIVHEIQRLLLVHPMLVLAAKSAAFGDKQSTTEVIRNSAKRFNEKVLDSRGPQNLSHRDYMPSAWQSFVSHRIIVRASDGESKNQNRPTFFTEWLLPSLKFSDKFTVNEDGHLVIL